MKHLLPILLTIALCITGCVTTKKAVAPKAIPFESGEWTTVRTSANIAVDYQGQHYEATTTMRGYRDSLAVISATALFGMELARAEATSKDIHVSSKLLNQNATITYEQATRLAGEEVTWRKIQELVAGVNLFKQLKVTYYKVDKQ